MAEVIEPGWYHDPRDQGSLRWWDGSAWTAWTHPAAARPRSPLGELPWVSWAVISAVVFAVGWACFGMAESVPIHRSGGWWAAGAAVIAVVALAGAASTLRRRPWWSISIFALVLSVVIAMAFFIAAAPSGTTSCQQATDCDTNFGLGLPFVVLALMVPLTVAVTVGWVIGHLVGRTTVGA